MPNNQLSESRATLSQLPFHNLDIEEFLKTSGAWLYRSADNLSHKHDLYTDIIASPDKDDPLKCLQDNYIESKYLTINQTGNNFYDATNQNGFSIMHCNTRSLGKNLFLLHDILISVKSLPDIIAISETKLNDYTSANLHIPGYLFIRTDSKSQAGGVGLYISDQLDFSRRRDLDISHDGIESCWIEITRERQKNVLVGCVYRHPKGNLEFFRETLKKQLDQLNTKGHEVLVLGDINVDFFKYNDDKQTSEYMDMLLDLGYLPLITKATRITYHTSTLIDHIYTNTPEKVIKSGICLADISDHLPIFCTLANTMPSSNEPKYFRDFSNFSKEHFLEDISHIDFMALITEDVNKSMNNIVEKLRLISNKHAPLRKASKQKKRQLKKPWISKAILISIKKKQRLFKSHFLSNDPRKIEEYKAYKNKLYRVIKAAKKIYLTNQFEMNKENLKVTWKLIGSVINRKKTNSIKTINRLFCNNTFYTDKAAICEQLNSYFINIGNKLADQLPPNNTNPTSYIKQSFLNSFMFRAIHSHEVHDELMSLKTNKSSIDIPRTCIKLAADHINEALMIVFNYSLVQGVFPEILKISKVTPVDKGGEDTDPSNYRPISTLSPLSQIFEKLICKQLVSYLEKEKILYEFQFGFRKGHSTSQAITEIAENLRKAVDNNMYSCVFRLLQSFRYC